MLRAVLTVVLAFGAGCTRNTVNDRCGTGPPCEPGSLCVGKICRQVCNTDGDCAASDEVCRKGLCEQDPNAGCTSDTDCVNPGPCESYIGASCLGGACVYPARPVGLICDDGDRCTENDVCDARGRCVGQAKVCASPPDSTCSVDDATFTAYPTVGICGAQGDCQYPPTVVPCAGCTATCLQSCAGIICADTAGGCQTHGVCTGVGGAACNYQPAAEGLRCARPGSEPGAADGVCVAGACIECQVPADCLTPPGGRQACFSATCTTGRCNYVPQPAVACEAAVCVDGFIYAARSCGPLGDCPPPVPAGTSCQGYACAGAATCKTTCASEADCAPGSTCLGGGICSPPAALGEACSDHGGCLSGYCADQVCCNRACAGICERCDDAGGSAGSCHLSASGSDPDDECTSLPTNCFANNCSGTAAACAVKASGSDCGPCRECDGAGLCLADDSAHAECAVCQRCSGGVCVNQSSSQDLKNECNAEASCGTGNCNGLGACSYVANEIDCGTCRRCDGAGSCATNSTDHGDCGLCAKCVAGSCVNQTGSEDLKDQCSPDSGCGSGNCNGDGTCNLAASNTDCGTCRRCDAVGACLTNSTDHSDCPICQKCVSGACAVQTSAEDLKNQCSPDAGCGTGDCNGGGACAYSASGTYCGLCAACNATGSCSQALADDAACGTIDCDGLDSTATCSNYNDLTSNRCEGANNCKDANTTDCTSVSPYPSGTVCRDNTGAQACDADELCNGAATSCPANDFVWSSGYICSGGTAGTLTTLATGRSNVTATDRNNCRDHCDTIAGVTCCLTEGIPAIPPYVPEPLVYCLPYTGATTLQANTTYDYWAALCR